MAIKHLEYLHQSMKRMSSKAISIWKKDHGTIDFSTKMKTTRRGLKGKERREGEKFPSRENKRIGPTKKRA